MDKHYRTATFLANLLDNQFSFFGLRFGLDPILGIIPGGGDMISLLVSLYILWAGIQMNVPQHKLRKMFINIVLDFAIGFVPVLGDIADFTFKSNLMNLEILKKHMEKDIIEGEVVS
ncbi:MAG: hypothetical protein ACD_22C00171G0008 [uncultured bacterium]|nr:MAG: hypothetical protein ACD_22C00171G0008 [uncultured bacterium]